jgi:class 3 adenylate cyclase
MVAEDLERRLAVILCADIVGYSRLIGADEEGTLRRLRDVRAELINPAIQTHHGRIIKTMGDGILVEFASVVDAVRAAVEVQRGVAGRNAKARAEHRIEFRMGIHLGDVMVQADGDLLGDSVNIAARLETIAEPGGVCISEDAYRQVRDRLKEEFVDLGDKQLKNIARPVQVFAINMGPSNPTGVNQVAISAKLQGQRKARQAQAESMQLPMQLRVRAPGLRSGIKTVQEAIKFIENMPTELASLQRWTFARALLGEAMQTGKSRDLNAAVRQFTQALRNERWLDETPPTANDT